MPIAVHVFLLNNKNVLLLKRANTGFQDNMWSVPAGRLDDGESFAEAAIREVKEEVDVKLMPADLSMPLIMHHKDTRGERIYIFYIARSWQGTPKNMEPDKCDTIKWFNINNLPNDIINHVSDALTGILNGKNYIEWGFGKIK